MAQRATGFLKNLKFLVSRRYALCAWLYAAQYISMEKLHRF